MDGFALVLGARGRFARVVTCAIVVALGVVLAWGALPAAVPPSPAGATTAVARP